MLPYVLMLIAYLLGSISSAILVCRLLGLPDPRTQGSGNPGATNVLRIGGKKAALMTLIGDAAKGLIPVLIAQALSLSPLFIALIGFAAFIGHLYPIFFGFQGGKGVATALGVQFGWSWSIGLSVALTWLIIAKLMRISSLAALVSMSLAPLYIYALGFAKEWVMVQILITILLIWRHRSNIKNLIQGQESKV